jgi:hypothetical protein
VALPDAIEVRTGEEDEEKGKKIKQMKHMQCCAKVPK